MLLNIFNELPDHRRAQGTRFDLAHLLLFSVLAIASNADSYRKIEIFIKEKFKVLKKLFKIKWKNPPSYSAIRRAICQVNSTELEKAFRRYSLVIANLAPDKINVVSLDGKTLKGSFDNFQDQAAIQIFSAFLQEKQLVLAHEEFDGHKTNEIPIAQKLIKELNLKNCLFTADAMHCQKKL